MPSVRLVRSFLILYVILGLVILIQSVETVVASRHGTSSSHDQIHALILGSLETLAALLFLVPRTMRVGAALLLGVFALAFGLHALGGHPNLALLVYGAGVLFVAVHGVTGYRWRVA